MIMYIVILNFESQSVDCLDLCNYTSVANDMDIEVYVESVLDYSLSNCEWMQVSTKPSEINFLN